MKGLGPTLAAGEERVRLLRCTGRARGRPSTWSALPLMTRTGHTGGSLLDHVVGAQQDRSRHRKAERLGGLEVDSHLKFDRPLNGQVGRLRATENAIDIEGGAKPYIQQVRSVGKQTAGSGNEFSPIDGWHVVSGCQHYN